MTGGQVAYTRDDLVHIDGLGWLDRGDVPTLSQCEADDREVNQ